MPEHLNVRGNPTDAAFARAVAGVLGVDLPTAPNTTRSGGEHIACWLGPDEWLVATRDSAALALALRGALAGVFSAVTEVGGGDEVIVLEAATARERLAAECPLDLDPRGFGPGQCAQTRFGHAAILLRPLDNGDMALVVRRSFAAYVRQLLGLA